MRSRTLFVTGTNVGAVAGQMEKHRSVKQNAHALTNLHDSRAIKQHIEHLVDDDTASPLHARDGEPEADGSSAPGKSASMVWGLLQKGLKKAMGPTRDQLEFTIKIRSMFDGFDQSGDGQLSGNELRKALKGLGVFISKREMVTLMLRFDQNLDGEIDHSEFEDMVKDLIPPPEFDIGGIFLEQKLTVCRHLPARHARDDSCAPFACVLQNADSHRNLIGGRICLPAWTQTTTGSWTVTF